MSHRIDRGAVLGRIAKAVTQAEGPPAPLGIVFVVGAVIPAPAREAPAPPTERP